MMMQKYKSEIVVKAKKVKEWGSNLNVGVRKDLSGAKKKKKTTIDIKDKAPGVSRN